MKKVTIFFKNGTKDWIDPVYRIIERRGRVHFEGSSYVYSYELDKIDKYDVEEE